VTSVVLLHDLGAEEAGGPWRAAAPSDWIIPDLPGHGVTPAPRHGAYDPLGPVTLARWALAAEPDPGRVVGIGQNAPGALILAAGAGCGAVAIVDGLWGPWQDAETAVDVMYADLRAIVADELAVAAPPAVGLDPRARHGYGVHASAPFVAKFWGAVACPVLAVETPASITPPADRAARAALFGGESTLIELDDVAPSVVVAAVLAWLPTAIEVR
jgi:hypothetical protein